MAIGSGSKTRPRARGLNSDVIEQMNGSLATAVIWWTVRGNSRRGTMRDSK